MILLVECQSCHKFKPEAIMENFGFPDLCIECNNPEKWKRIQLREKWDGGYYMKGYE
jgi:hypothetical protein